MAFDHLARVVAGRARRLGRIIDVVARDRPADQPAVRDPVDAVRARIRRLGLSGVRSDDLEVRGWPERQQLVVGALTEVLSAAVGSDAESLLNLPDAILEIRRRVDEVIDVVHRFER